MVVLVFSLLQEHERRVFGVTKRQAMDAEQ